MTAEHPTLAEVIEKHRWVSRSTTTRYVAACVCGWEKDIVNTQRTGLQLHGEHVESVWRDACTITTVEQLDALPPESIVKSEGGSVACRFYDGIHGVTFGDERPFKWTVLASELPAVVLWHPGWSANA